jgi:aquaporin Z
MNKQLAEFVGTFALVFFGCGAAVVGGMGSGPTAVNLLGISSAFGLAIVAMAYGIGPISGCHVNPAVSFGMFVAGRMSADETIRYWIAQVLGAIAAALVLYIILSGKAQGWSGSLGQNGWGAGYNGEYNIVAAFVFEAVATFLFLVTILGVTHPFTPAGFAGLAIGLTLVRRGRRLTSSMAFSTPRRTPVLPDATLVVARSADSNGSSAAAILVSDAYGMPVFSARSLALDGVSWA